MEKSNHIPKVLEEALVCPKTTINLLHLRPKLWVDATFLDNVRKNIAFPLGWLPVQCCI